MQKTLLYACVLLFVFSCQDKDDDLDTPAPAPKCSVSKIIQGTHNGAEADTTHTFYYDATGKISKVNFKHPESNSDDDIYITRDDSGSLTKASSYMDNIYKYTANGRLSEIIWTHRDTLRFRYVYGASEIPEKSLRYKYSFVTKTWDSTYEYHYTFQNGNMVTRETFKKGVSTEKEYYEYDTIPNIATDLILLSQNRVVPIGFYDEFLYFNKNVLKKYKGSSSQYYIDYKTDSGRITKSVLSFLKSPAYTDTSGQTTRYYFYECQ